MKIKQKSVQYSGRDEVENIVKEKDIDRTRFYDIKYFYCKVI